MSFLKNIFGSDDTPKQNVAKVNWIELKDLTQLQEIVTLSEQNPVVIFKHSTRCIISRTVLKNFEKEFDLESKVKPYFLDLLEFRPISNEIASLFNVTHQSPQLILVKDGKAIYNASHDNIEVKDLKNYL